MLDKGATCSLLSKGQNTLPNTTFLKESLSEYNHSKKPSLALTSELSRVGGASAPRSNPCRGANSFATPSPLVFRVYSLYFFVFFFVFVYGARGSQNIFGSPSSQQKKKCQNKRKKRPRRRLPRGFFPDTKGKHISKHLRVARPASCMHEVCNDYLRESSWGVGV